MLVSPDGIEPSTLSGRPVAAFRKSTSLIIAHVKDIRYSPRTIKLKRVKG